MTENKKNCDSTDIPYISLYFVTTYPKKLVLHTCLVPENMPFKHSVAQAWEDFKHKKPNLSERVKKRLNVRLTANLDCQRFDNEPQTLFA